MLTEPSVLTEPRVLTEPIVLTEPSAPLAAPSGTTAVRAASGVLDGPRVRVLRAALPPYDDERESYCTVLPGQVGLDLSEPEFSKPEFSEPEPLRIASTSTPLDQVDDETLRRTRTGDLPAALGQAHVLALGMVEVLAGIRPLVQLTRSTSETVYAQLARAVRPASRPAPAAGRPSSVRAPTVRSVRVSHPTDGVAEVVAVIDRRHRVSMLAFRMEGIHGRWRCTELVVG